MSLLSGAELLYIIRRLGVRAENKLADWGHEAFRGPQLDICMSVMRGCDVLVVAPTGIGKS